MQTYFLKRIGLLFFTLLGITVISFTVLQLAPGSPLEMKIATGPGGTLTEKSAVTEEVLERLRKQYHLDRPIYERYWLWLSDIVQLDLGTSYDDHRPVIDKILERLPVSLTFGISGLLIALFIGLPLGIVGALNQSKGLDYAITFSSLVFYALPSYVLGIYLLTFFAGPYFIDFFPLGGLQSDTYESLGFFEKIGDRLVHIVLPITCYAISGLAYLIQQQRAALLDALGQDFVRTARAKGLSERVVVWKHAFRNSLIPVLTIFGAMLPTILGASIIIENLFSIPGLGQLALDALLKRDYPVIMANLLIGGFLSLLGLFLSDVFYALADPRISFD